MQYFKILGNYGDATNGGCYSYDLPVNGKKGAYTTKEKPCICHTGYHLSTLSGLGTWLRADRRLFIAEPHPHASKSVLGYEDKVAFSQVRLVNEIGKITLTRLLKICRYLNKKYNLKYDYKDYNLVDDFEVHAIWKNIWNTLSDTNRKAALPVMFEIIRGNI